MIKTFLPSRSLLITCLCYDGMIAVYVCVDVYVNFFLALCSRSVASGVRTWRSVEAGVFIPQKQNNKKKNMSTVYQDLFVAYFQFLRFERVTEKYKTWRLNSIY